MNFTSQIVLEMLKLKKILQFDWPKAFLFITREPDFSQTCGFHRNTKLTMVHHLKPKKVCNDGTIF